MTYQNLVSSRAIRSDCLRESDGSTKQTQTRERFTISSSQLMIPAVHYAAHNMIYCPRYRTIIIVPAVQHTDIPPPQSTTVDLHTIAIDYCSFTVRLRAGGWVGLSTQKVSNLFLNKVTRDMQQLKVYYGLAGLGLVFGFWVFCWFFLGQFVFCG